MEELVCSAEAHDICVYSTFLCCVIFDVFDVLAMLAMLTMLAMLAYLPHHVEPQLVLLSSLLSPR